MLMHRYMLTLPEQPHPSDDAALRRGVVAAASSATNLDATLERTTGDLIELEERERVVLVELIDGWIRLYGAAATIDLLGVPIEATEATRAVLRGIRDKIRATL
jgi:hypothetical protein